MAFDPAKTLSSAVSTAQSAFGVISSGLNTASRVGSVISNLSRGGDIASAIRSINLPLGGESINKFLKSTATYQDAGDAGDWRARLSMPRGSFFDEGEVLKPLLDAGGLIFPYTPTITINHSASYNTQQLTHQNYNFIAYQNSPVSDITISGEFTAEDAVQAKYWLAAVHFLRSVTKMFTGDTSLGGNPPPILNFSAYGDYVFRNVPVVVKSFNMTLPKEVDYISTEIAAGAGFGTALSELASTAQQAAGLVNAVGMGRAADAISAAATGASIISGLGVSGAAGGMKKTGVSYVPTQSQMSVTVTPVYSREKIRNFSLEKFVKGGYVNDGYI